MVEDIISLKNQNRPIREISETVGVGKSTSWYILKQSNSATSKSLGGHGKQLNWMIAEFFPC